MPPSLSTGISLVQHAAFTDGTVNNGTLCSIMYLTASELEAIIEVFSCELGASTVRAQAKGIPTNATPTQNPYACSVVRLRSQARPANAVVWSQLFYCTEETNFVQIFYFLRFSASTLQRS